MARMLGRYASGECGCLDCSPPRGRHSSKLSSRWRKRVEARQWLAAEGWLPKAALPAPGDDDSDCRHGCNGDEVVNGHESDVCNWQCHPHLRLDPERAARFGATIAEGS